MIYNKKLIVRIKGGLGNQLFCYAVAKAIALRNNAELILDNQTGFIRDFKYNRNYQLDNFNIKSRLATKSELLYPFSRIRRGLLISLNIYLPFFFKNYIYQKSVLFDANLLNVKFKNILYLDGCWQSEFYFKEFENIIRNDLIFDYDLNEENLNIYNTIIKEEAVAIHFRFFDHNENSNSMYNLNLEYYNNAIKEIKKRIQTPHFFIFTDSNKNNNFEFLKYENYTLVTTNNSIIDFHLMSKCKYFIIANSTYSWWAAWLSNSKFVIAPNFNISGITSWGFDKLIPDTWKII